MGTADPTLTEAAAVARALLVAPVDAIERVHGPGRNSRIYQVRSGGDLVALKQYPSRREDPRDRLSTEAGALNLMVGHGNSVVPRMVASDAERRYGMLGRGHGEPGGNPAAAGIDAPRECILN